MSISASSVLVELNISVWPASKVDREVTDTVNAAANASSGASQLRKNLFAGTNLRKDIEKLAARVRLYHNLHTLPWADKGERLCPTSIFLEYKQVMNNYEAQFNAMCDSFFNAYDDLVREAPLHLGTLYKADDYPSLDEVKGRFAFRRSVKPLPEAGDLRLDIPAADLEELRGEYERQYQEKLAEAMRTPWQRLFDLLTNMSEKLTDDAGEGATKKRYHDSFVTNANELVDLLKKMNVTNDPKLEQARRQLEIAMVGIEIEDIKESADTRADVKKRVDDILGKFDW